MTLDTFINHSGPPTVQPSTLLGKLAQACTTIAERSSLDIVGKVHGVSGLGLDLTGLAAVLAVGDRVRLHGRDTSTEAEVTSFQGTQARAMAMGPLAGIGPGARVTAKLDRCGRQPKGPAGLGISDGWLGRVVDPLGNPLDGKGPPPLGPHRPVRAPPPPAASRTRLGERLSLGVRVLDLFTTCRAGQRLGLFAGSGVGKSTLLAMLAQRAECDVVVLALVGERGREVREFIEDDLGPALPVPSSSSPPPTNPPCSGAKQPMPPWPSPSISATRAVPSSC